MSAPDRTILITGPARDPAPYVAAAKRAGWNAVGLPLLRIEPRAFTVSDGAPPAWICVTSSNALPALEELLERRPEWRAAAKLAVVGERTAARLAERGLRPALPPAASARDLARALRAEAAAGARVLWLRGDRATELAESLRAGGLEVEDPVVYASLAVDGPALPERVDAALFTSPSAVQAFLDVAPAGSRPIAVAIGPTTRDALESAAAGSAFAAVHELREPRPESLEQLLSTL